MKWSAFAILLLCLPKAVPAQRSNPAIHRPEFSGVRLAKNYTQTINASPDRIFPLLCPIREAEWADGWVARVIYAASGYAETDGVYASEHGEKDDTIWVITRRDLSQHEIEFVYFVPRKRVAKLTIAVEAIAADKSAVHIQYLNTGLSEEGNREIQRLFTDASFTERMAEWERSMNYFLDTGKLLKTRK